MRIHFQDGRVVGVETVSPPESFIAYLRRRNGLTQSQADKAMEWITKNYTLACNQVQVGGASYQATWPYSGINFYSVYYPGSQPNGSNDWHTWLLGMQYAGSKPYLYAIMQFKWEP